MDDMAEEQHERTCHRDAQTHHRHTHAAGSRHEGGHHLLQVEGLEVGFRMYDEDAPFFRAKRRVVPVIEDMSISVHAGEIVAVVGASGSGKTLLVDAVFGLFESNAVVRGRIWFDGVRQDAASLSRLRGRGTEDEAAVQKRLARAEEELREKDAYDFAIVNDDARRCADELYEILRARQSE